MRSPTLVPVVFRPVYVLLADGSGAQIRSATMADHDEIAALHARASDESFYRRFFSASRAAADPFIDSIGSPTPRRWTLLAIRSGHVAGIATASGDGASGAEVAFLVDETMHGLGIGTVLLEHLARWSRRMGCSSFAAEVLADNLPMLRVFHDAGFGLSEQREHGVVTLTMDLRVSAATVAASDARERQAEHHSLEPLFTPRSVAVLGVSRTPDKIGRAVLDSIRCGDFAGSLHALGRPGLQVPAVSCVSTIEQLPDHLDLVVVALPAPQLEGAVARIARKRTRCCVVLTAGLGETSAPGRETERRIAAVAREHEMRLVGPNCFGVLSNLRGTRLDATFGQVHPHPGGLAIGSQSGGVGLALLEAAEARDTGIGCFVSLGNTVDVTDTDLLAAWTDDHEVSAAALYLESFRDPRRFARIAATFSRRKPLLVVFGGSSAAGTRAGASHTAAQATPARAIQAVFRAAGAVDVEGAQDLVDTAALLTEQPLPRGPRLGIIGNAGGLGILAADAAHRLGIEVPELDAATRAALTRQHPGPAGTSNPVDLGAGADDAAFGGAVKILLSSGEVDALLVGVAGTAVTDMDAITRSVDQASEAAPDLPCLLVRTGAVPARRGHATRFPSSDAAVRALAHAVRYARWRRESDVPLPVPAIDVQDLYQVTGPTDDLAQSASTWLGADEAQALLSDAGVRGARYRQVRSVREALDATNELGFPVVVKTADPAVVHKTDQNLIRTGVASRADLAAAVRDVLAIHPRGGVLVQEQLTGPELALGVVRDPRFGPLVMVATGGVQLDLWDDQTFLMPPLSRSDVLGALKSLRTWPLLSGYRGSRPRDQHAVADLVVAVAQLALDRSDLAELDLNPVIITDTGPVSADTKVRLTRTSSAAT